MEASLKFNSLDPTHIKNLQSLVATDRFSTGESVLDLHAKDQSPYSGYGVGIRIEPGRQPDSRPKGYRAGFFADEPHFKHPH
jgi:hypothetical protein